MGNDDKMLALNPVMDYRPIHGGVAIFRVCDLTFFNALNEKTVPKSFKTEPIGSYYLHQQKRQH